MQKQCIAPVSATVMADPNKANLKNADWMGDFVNVQVPKMADYNITVAPGDTARLDSSNIGTPGNPKITFVNGIVQPLDWILAAGDDVGIFPPIGGG